MKIIALSFALALVGCVTMTPPPDMAACVTEAKAKVPEMRGLNGDMATWFAMTAVTHHWGRERAVANGVGDGYAAITECMARQNIEQQP